MDKELFIAHLYMMGAVHIPTAFTKITIFKWRKGLTRGYLINFIHSEDATLVIGDTYARLMTMGFNGESTSARYFRFTRKKRKFHNYLPQPKPINYSGLLRHIQKALALAER